MPIFKKVKKESAVGIVIGVLLPIMVFSLLPATDTGQTLELAYIDFLFTLRGDRDAPDNVVIVAVDEPSFQEIGIQWPWPRQLHAMLIDQLKAAGAKTIAFDVLFVEASDEEGDKTLADAAKRAGNVIFGATVSQVKRQGYVQSIMVEPLDILKEAARDVALVNFFPDPDGIIRHGRAVISSMKTLAGASAENAGFVSSDSLSEWPYLIDFAGQSGTVKTVSYYQALSPNDFLPPDTFKDKMVFVGFASDAAIDIQGAVDAFPTPFFRISRKMMFGVEIHANSASTLANGTPLKEIKGKIILLIFFILSILPMLSRTRPLMLLLSAASILLSLAGISIYLFIGQNMLLNVAMALTATGASAIWWAGYGFLSNVREKRQIKGAFDRYVTPDVVKEVLKNPDMLQLGGQKKELSVLFSDIRGFTTLSEKLDPEDLVSLLNSYLTNMTEKVFLHHGTLDKYIGDAIMAIFGAPLERPDHAACACRTAVDMISALSGLTPEWEQMGLPAPRIGIGINTGFMVVGNMGSEKRFDYTVMGDEVNLASRLEGLNKTYKTCIIIAENTKKAVENDGFLLRELDSVRVKGKKLPVRIYEVMGYESEADDALKRVSELFIQGLEAYRKQEWEGAKRIFNEILSIRADDGPASVFIERCDILKENPPGADWDGVWVMTTK